MIKIWLLNLIYTYPNIFVYIFYFYLNFFKIKQMLKKFIYNCFFFFLNITHGDEAVEKYLVYVVKWVALEGSHTLSSSSKQEETRKAGDVLFSC
jgi:hypothetical protein